VAFSPDGALLASGGSGGQTVKLWDAGTGQELRSLKGHTDHVMCVAFSPDGALLASGGDDGTVKVWDAGTGQELLTFNTGPVFSVAFGPGGAGFIRPVLSVAFSPDGARLAGGTSVWDARLLGPPDAEELLVRRAQTRLDAAWHKAEAARWEKDKQWQTAAFHLEHALRAQPGDGDLGRRLTVALAQAAASDRTLPNAATWRRLALAQLHTRQVDAYRLTCQQMQERFAVAGEARQAAFLLAGPPGFGLAAHRLALTDSAFGCGLFEWQETIRAAVLQPGVLKDPETWLARLPKDDKLLRGAILCRAGKHAEAAELSDVRDPVGLLFRAVAESGRGNQAAARAALAKARKLIPPDKIDLVEQSPLPWLEVVETRVLVNELETLLSSK
jgi:hypothetical protein